MSSILTAFDSVAIGTRVTDRHLFLALLDNRLDRYAFPENGQAVVPLDHAIAFVSCGVARRSILAVSDYIVRVHRGETCLCAKRNLAATVESLHVVVYTRKAYLADPEVDDAERRRIGDADFVIVAVIAAAGPKPPVSSYRFVRNLAGGNNRYKPENGYTIEQAVAEAAEIAAYEKEWITVAD